MSRNDKQRLFALTKNSDWPFFIKMLNNYKSLLINKVIIHGKDSIDLADMRGSIKTITVLKTFQNRYKNMGIDPKTEDNIPSDPSNTISLDD